MHSFLANFWKRAFSNNSIIEFIPIKVNKFDIINKPLIFKSVPMKKKIPNEIQSNIHCDLHSCLLSPIKSIYGAWRNEPWAFKVINGTYTPIIYNDIIQISGWNQKSHIFWYMPKKNRWIPY